MTQRLNPLLLPPLPGHGASERRWLAKVGVRRAAWQERFELLGHSAGYTPRYTPPRESLFYLVRVPTVVWKVAYSGYNRAIVELALLEDTVIHVHGARHVVGHPISYRKCRASGALVLSVYDTARRKHVRSARSQYATYSESNGRGMVYMPNQLVFPSNPRQFYASGVCGHGIHFFFSRDDALEYTFT